MEKKRKVLFEKFDSVASLYPPAFELFNIIFDLVNQKTAKIAYLI